MTRISLENIAKSFGNTRVLGGINLAIEPSEFVTLVGPSGCGKSTLLRILAGLEAPDEGQVLLDGNDVTHMRPADRNLAMVFQSYALYPHLTVADNMMTPLKLRDLNWMGRLPILGPLTARSKYRALRQQVQNAAKSLQIETLLDRKPGALSGGQRQRAALGRAMVRNPVAFLMDEPLSNLDAALRVHMRAELSALHRRLETTFVYVTHDQAEALTMSDRMAVMMDGAILQYGAPDRIYHDPNCLDVARFVGSPAINTLPGEVTASGVFSVLGQNIGTVHGISAQPVTVAVRPEAMKIDPRGLFPATVLHRENLGSELFLHLGLPGLSHPLILRTDPATAIQHAIGGMLQLSFGATDAHLFDAQGGRLARVVTHHKTEVA
ncbi:MAG: ABC transporter ATP-binding protein [Pseudomonadota bacterium]